MPAKSKVIAKKTTVMLSTITAQKLDALIEMTGQTQTNLVNLAVQAGLDAIALAINPDWKDYFEKQVAQYDTKIKKL